MQALMVKCRKMAKEEKYARPGRMRINSPAAKGEKYALKLNEELKIKELKMNDITEIMNNKKQKW